MDDISSLLQRLRKSYKAIYGKQINESTTITDMITSVIGLSTGRVQDSGAAIADRVAAPIGKYNNLEHSKVARRYNSRLPLLIIILGT
jgi:hypothetical protein